MTKKFETVLSKLTAVHQSVGDDGEEKGMQAHTESLPHRENYGEHNFYQISYALGDGSEKIPLHAGMVITIQSLKSFTCMGCQKVVKKIFGAFCFVCLKKKAMADNCIMSPELCHYMKGTCREPEWGAEHCYIPHFVYLSYTDKYKVGITRHHQIPTRWIDQGATAGIILAKVSSRHQSGLIEHYLKGYLSDRTHWLKMLQMQNNTPPYQEFMQERDRVLALIKENISSSSSSFYPNLPNQLSLSSEIFLALDEKPTFLQYPLTQVNGEKTNAIIDIEEKNTGQKKIIDDLKENSQTTLFEDEVSLNKKKPSLKKDVSKSFRSLSLEKEEFITGTLLGIKGQYLYFDEGRVFNVRKHEGFNVSLTVSDVEAELIPVT